MKLLVVSDIHSNIWALETILSAEKAYDQLCCAGDLVDYGIAPKEVISTLRQKKENSMIVQGNHDRHVAKTYHEHEFRNIAPAMYKWVHYNCERLSNQDISYLSALPLHRFFEADGWHYLMQHQYDEAYGCIETSHQFELYWKSHTPKEYWNAERKRMIFGHSHRQCRHQLATGMEWINPGSVSYRRPDDPDKSAHYACIEEGRLTLKRIPYDRTPQLEEARKYHERNAMMETELQDFFFFFGSAETSRDPLPMVKKESKRTNS